MKIDDDSPNACIGLDKVYFKVLQGEAVANSRGQHADKNKVLDKTSIII